MIEGIIAAIVGAAIGVGGKVAHDKQVQTKGQETAEKLVARAERIASVLAFKTKDEALKIEQESRRELKQSENRLVARDN